MRNKKINWTRWNRLVSLSIALNPDFHRAPCNRVPAAGTRSRRAYDLAFRCFLRADLGNA